MRASSLQLRSESLPVDFSEITCSRHAMPDDSLEASRRLIVMATTPPKSKITGVRVFIDVVGCYRRGVETVVRVDKILFFAMQLNALQAQAIGDRIKG